MRAGLEALVRLALEEDIGDGDRTTDWTVPPDARGTARIRSKEDGVIAGIEFADAVFEGVDPSLVREWRCEDGARIGPGEDVLRLDGSLPSILRAERTALNGLARLSGIASLTARFVSAVAGTGAALVDTRKTTPGWRRLEKAATAAGGARNHRMGLYDMVLIKENHIRAAGGIAAALDAARSRASAEGLEIEIEVTDMDEFEAARRGGPDRILLDNMSLEELREAVRRRGDASRPLLEASGGVDLDSVRAVAATGVDLISVGAITHSAPALDLSLQVDP